jgi:hypothetical protein
MSRYKFHACDTYLFNSVNVLEIAKTYLMMSDWVALKTESENKYEQNDKISTGSLLPKSEEKL